jgi:hypothetical protein
VRKDPLVLNVLNGLAETNVPFAVFTSPASTVTMRIYNGAYRGEVDFDCRCKRAPLGLDRGMSA